MNDFTPPRFVSSLVSRLAAACRPDEIVLFGSYAKGLADNASDVDFLLVFSRPPSVALKNAAFDNTRGALNVDVHLHDRAELVAAARDPHGFLGSVLRSGRSVYRKTDSRPILVEIALPRTAGRT
jgi:predicted nucleotidyltransferase